MEAAEDHGEEVMPRNIEEVLKQNINRKIEISTVNPIEGIPRYTKGKLLAVNNEMIVMAVDLGREHKWSKKEKGIYHLNRQSCTLMSLVVLEE